MFFRAARVCHESVSESVSRVTQVQGVSVFESGYIALAPCRVETVSVFGLPASVFDICYRVGRQVSGLLWPDSSSGQAKQCTYEAQQGVELSTHLVKII